MKQTLQAKAQEVGEANRPTKPQSREPKRKGPTLSSTFGAATSSGVRTRRIHA